MHRGISRRRAIQSMAAATFSFTLLPAGSARAYAANEKLNIALVRIGGRGRWFVDTIPRIGENVVAVCEVNDGRAAESLKKMAHVPRFYDYRKMDEVTSALDCEYREGWTL